VNAKERRRVRDLAAVRDGLLAGLSLSGAAKAAGVSYECAKVLCRSNDLIDNDKPASVVKQPRQPVNGSAALQPLDREGISDRASGQFYDKAGI
jgi:hypothetical protein